jgi:hypothetical protein
MMLDITYTIITDSMIKRPMAFAAGLYILLQVVEAFAWLPREGQKRFLKFCSFLYIIKN